MTTSDRIILVAAAIAGIFGLINILINSSIKRKVSYKVKEDEEKRRLRTKIHDRMSTIEDKYLSTYKYNNKVGESLTMIASSVKVYDPELASLIRRYKKSWRDRFSLKNGKQELALTAVYLEVYQQEHEDTIRYIHDRADFLTKNYTIMDRIRVKYSWIKFRIKLVLSNRDEKRKFKAQAW